MPSLSLCKPRISLRLPPLQREKKWHYAWMLFSWACLIFVCLRGWQVIQGRMYYLLDSDMSSDLVLSYLLRKEHALLSTNWF